MNKFYDPKLRSLCRDTMRNFLRLYFEFAFKLDNLDVTTEVVAKTNDMAMEVEDEEITDERLLTIYQLAVINLEKIDGLKNFCLLPTLFLAPDIDVT